MIILRCVDDFVISIMGPHKMGPMLGGMVGHPKGGPWMDVKGPDERDSGHWSLYHMLVYLGWIGGWWWTHIFSRWWARRYWYF